MKRKYFRTWLQKYSYFQVWKKSDIQVRILFTLIFSCWWCPPGKQFIEMGSVLFWDFTQCRVVVSHWWSGQPVGPVFKGWMFDLWRWDWLVVPKHWYETTMICHMKSQNSRVLVYIMMEAWNHRLLERVGWLQAAHEWLIVITVGLLFAGYCVRSFTIHSLLVLPCSVDCLLVEHIKQYIV